MRNIVIDTSKIFDDALIKFMEYQLIGIESSIDKLPKNGVEYFSQLNLSEKRDKLTPGMLKKRLNTERRKHHFITVEAATPAISSLSARDGRIDAVRLSNRGSLRIFNVKYARRLKENNKFIILDLKNVIENFKASNLRQLIRVLDATKKVRLPIIVSNRPREGRELKTYRSLQALASSFGIERRQTNAIRLLDRIELNKDKIKGDIPFPGIILEDD